MAEQRRQSRRAPQKGPSTGALILGLIANYAMYLGALVYVFDLSIFVPLVIVLLSLLTYLVYRRDKRAAQEKRWRTSERNLHLLSLLGGWPGALIAQNWLRHKSSKKKFRIVFFVTIFLNVAAIGSIGVGLPAFLLALKAMGR